MTAAAVAQRCDPRARRSGGGWIARCPAHRDNSPSLSVRAGRDGRVVVHCWAGCATADVLRAVGLAWADVFGDARPMTRAQVQAHRRRQRAAERQHERLAAEARALAERIRRLGALEVRAVDRVRDIHAGAPERWAGEMWLLAEAAAGWAGDTSRLAAEHDRRLGRLYSRQGRGADAAREVAA